MKIMGIGKMNNLVKIITDEDGSPVEPLWHLASFGGGSPVVLCDGQVFGYGEGDAVFEEKTMRRGGITCPCCIDHIKLMKAVKL
jgi:hypothetical protein